MQCTALALMMPPLTVQLIERVDNNPQTFFPVIQELQDFIETNPNIMKLFAQMFEAVPTSGKYINDPDGNPEVRDYMHMLALFNAVIVCPPPWSDVASIESGLVGFPINAILDWPMGTLYGYWLFTRCPDLNAKFKNMLDYWGSYLKSPDSTSVLNTAPGGWLSPHALSVLVAKAADGMPNPPTSFEQIYRCDPSLPSYGFESWDKFFTREFVSGVRPVASPNDQTVIVNACESAPYRLVQNVQLAANIFLKGQPYSLVNMLDDEQMALKFAGGTVYQAFLSALSYHRWHSPVTGTIVETKMIPGTYYSEDFLGGFCKSLWPRPRC